MTIHFVSAGNKVPMSEVKANDIVAYSDGSVYRIVAHGNGFRFHLATKEQVSAAVPTRARDALAAYERNKQEHEDACWMAQQEYYDYQRTISDFEAGTGRI